MNADALLLKAGAPMQAPTLGVVITGLFGLRVERNRAQQQGAEDRKG
jgi:hypothetical protein